MIPEEHIEPCNAERQAVKGRGAQKQTDNPFDRHLYEEEEGSWDASEREDTSTKYLRVHPITIVNRVDSPDIPFRYSLNPYQGCEHGCVYCYARNSHEFWGYNAGLDFERFIMVKENAPELLTKLFRSGNWVAQPIMLSGNTDCYQPVEKKLGITRKLLRVFADHRHPVGMITKNSMVLRDLDLLEILAADQLVHVAVSLTGMDEGLRRNMEPRTASYAKRLSTIRALAQRGIPVSVMMAPLIPGLNTQDIMKVAGAAADAGALSFGVIPVRLNGRIAEVFKDWLELHYPGKAGMVWRQIRALHGGSVGDSRFGKRMTGEGKLAEVMRQQVALARRRYFGGRSMPEYNLSVFRGSQLRLF